MPTPAHVLIVKLRKWFPPNDPIAAKIARLCILREDLLLEMQGVVADDIPQLDDYSSQFRKMYFFRNLLRTQSELSSAIQALLGDGDFKGLLRGQKKDVQTEFRKAAKAINRGHATLHDVRNDICAHVSQNAVQQALERIDERLPDAFGFLDIGPKANLTHYKFAGELTAEILLKGVSERERQMLESSKFALLAELLPTFGLIELCLIMYSEDRGLMKFRGSCGKRRLLVIREVPPSLMLLC
jgi:hypothetical protein